VRRPNTGEAAPAADRPHHDARGFHNVDAPSGPGLLDLLRWRLQRLGRRLPGADSYRFPIASDALTGLHARHSRPAATWIGHATVLMQIDGINLLTDPHFSQRASPVQWAGPRRVVPPGVALDELPPIHVVLISHDHYDSLDHDSIRRLRERHGGAETRFMVPLGLKHWFQRRGITNVTELDWWQHSSHGRMRITAVPTQHWSKRRLFSRNRTLWAGWAVHTPDFRFLFVGDTGYTTAFQRVGAELGPFDLAAIPIGAYEPRWFMANHHVAPEQALLIHRDVRARRSIAIHWGTFVLTDEPLDEPPRRLREALQRDGLPMDAFRVLLHGETIEIPPDIP